MKKLLTVLSILMTTQMAIAGGTKNTKIQKLYVYDDHLVMKMGNTHTNVDSCTNANADEFLYLETTSEGGKKLYSAMLSAYVSGSKVKLGYASCINWGPTTIPKVYGIVLLK